MSYYSYFLSITRQVQTLIINLSTTRMSESHAMNFRNLRQASSQSSAQSLVYNRFLWSARLMPIGLYSVFYMSVHADFARFTGSVKIMHKLGTGLHLFVSVLRCLKYRLLTNMIN